MTPPWPGQPQHRPLGWTVQQKPCPTLQLEAGTGWHWLAQMSRVGTASLGLHSAGPGELRLLSCSHPAAESPGLCGMKRGCLAGCEAGAPGIAPHATIPEAAPASAAPRGSLRRRAAAWAAKEVQMPPAALCHPGSPPAPAAPCVAPRLPRRDGPGSGDTPGPRPTASLPAATGLCGAARPEGPCRVPASAGATLGRSPTCFFVCPGGVGFFLLYYFSNNPGGREDLRRSSASLQNHQ